MQMRRSRSHHVPFILGLLALGWGVACVAMGAFSEGPSLKLSALAQPDFVLMSCDQQLASAPGSIRRYRSAPAPGCAKYCSCVVASATAVHAAK